MRQVYERLKAKSTKVTFGKGKVDGNVLPSLDDERGRQLHLQLSTAGGGSVCVNFAEMTYPPFSDLEKKQELLTRLNQVPGISIPEDKLKTYAVFAIKNVLEHSGMAKLLEVVDWVIKQVVESRPVGRGTST